MRYQAPVVCLPTSPDDTVDSRPASSRVGSGTGDGIPVIGHWHQASNNQENYEHYGMILALAIVDRETW